MTAGGALIFEQPFGVAPSAMTLVARNRLQTGLADAVPARRLPELPPAWRKAGRLAARIGDRPLARPVHADGTETWLTELAALPAEHPSDTTGGGRQLTFEELGRG